MDHLEVARALSVKAKALHDEWHFATTCSDHMRTQEFAWVQGSPQRYRRGLEGRLPAGQSKPARRLPHVKGHSVDRHGGVLLLCVHRAAFHGAEHKGRRGEQLVSGELLPFILCVGELYVRICFADILCVSAYAIT